MPGNVKLLTIERGGDALTPDHETRLRANGSVTIVGIESEVDQVAHLFAQDIKNSVKNST